MIDKKSVDELETCVLRCLGRGASAGELRVYLEDIIYRLRAEERRQFAELRQDL